MIVSASWQSNDLDGWQEVGESKMLLCVCSLDWLGWRKTQHVWARLLLGICSASKVRFKASGTSSGSTGQVYSKGHLKGKGHGKSSVVAGSAPDEQSTAAGADIGEDSNISHVTCYKWRCFFTSSLPYAEQYMAPSHLFRLRLFDRDPCKENSFLRLF